MCSKCVSRLTWCIDRWKNLICALFQASEELENRESLAQIAASGEDTSLSDGETYIGMS